MPNRTIKFVLLCLNGVNVAARLSSRANQYLCWPAFCVHEYLCQRRPQLFIRSVCAYTWFLLICVFRSPRVEASMLLCYAVITCILYTGTNSILRIRPNKKKIFFALIALSSSLMIWRKMLLLIEIYFKTNSHSAHCLFEYFDRLVLKHQCLLCLCHFFFCLGLWKQILLCFVHWHRLIPRISSDTNEFTYQIFILFTQLTVF
jgi:hypothetical protein